MTTPTEELAKECGLLSETTIGTKSWNTAKLQAFRSAVETEYEAERMKQEPYAYEVESGSYEVLVYPEAISENHEHKESNIVAKLYTKPFPTTEQLQQQVKVLTDAIVETKSLLAASMHEHRPASEYKDEIISLNKALANTQGEWNDWIL